MSKNSDFPGKKTLFFGLSLAAVAAATSGAAVAQEATPAQEAQAEEIVVTGFRQSLAAAIDMKRNSAAQIDGIVAEDIADFPDLNLSESIQRIPGVAITRDAGEGRQISVRGLGPDFTRVRINGLEALATGGGTDAAGGTNRDRAFDFNIFASDLFNSIIVRKTASAEVEEGSLGATVDLRTARPFDYDGYTLAISGQAGYNDLSESYDPRVAFLISDTWMDGRLGALFSVAYANRSLLEEGASTVRWQAGGAAPCRVAQAAPVPGNEWAPGNACFGNVLGQTDETLGADYDAVNAAFRPRIPRYDIYEHEQDRLGATASFQFRPTDATEFSLDILYANFEATRSETFLESPVFSTNGGNGINNVEVLDYEIQGNTLVYGEFNNVDIRSESRFDELQTEFTQVTLDGEHEFTDSLRLHGLIGHARSDHDNPVQTTLLFDADNIDGYTYDFRGNNRLPVITYGTTQLTDPATWHLEQIRLRPQTALNTFTTAQGDLSWDIAPSFTVRGGVNWKRYEFESTELRRSNGTTSNQEASIPAFIGAIPLANYSTSAFLSGRGFDIPSAVPAVWLIPNLNAAESLFGLNDPSAFPLGIEPALGNNRSVEEEDTGGYVQADWSTEVAGMPFRGNIGVRYVETQQSSAAFATSGTGSSQTFQQVTAEREYEDTLPSLNLVLEPVDDFLVRFAAAKVMSRPGLGNLSPSATVTVSGQNRTVNAGNPQLDPFRANSYDLSFEWYFADDALFSVALFYKDIDSFVQTVRETRPFTGNPLGIPDSAATAACPGGVDAPDCNPGINWDFNIPQNTPGGPVQGIEIGLQLPFFFLPDVWSNFGFAGNFTYVESEIDYVNGTGMVILTDELQGLSPKSYNATLYYEDDRFGARVSAAYRSDYLTTIPGRNSNDSESTASTLNVDAAASWTFNERLKFTLEGLNLTDEVNDQFVSPDDRLSFYHHFGRQYFLGFRYTY